MQKQGPFRCSEPYFCGNPAKAHDEYEGKKWNEAVWSSKSPMAIYMSSGSGVALISNFEQLLRGVWRPETNEILNMSL